MPRATKRSKPLLVVAAVWILAMHFVDIYWCVMPAAREHGPHFGLLDVSALLAVGGPFLATFAWISSRRALVPVGDPRLSESLAFQQDF